jgi:hypothetical protein
MIETRRVQTGERRRDRTVPRTSVAAIVAVLGLAAAGCDTGTHTSSTTPPTQTAGPETNEAGQEANEVAGHTIPDKPGVYRFDLEDQRGDAAARHHHRLAMDHRVTRWHDDRVPGHRAGRKVRHRCGGR